MLKTFETLDDAILKLRAAVKGQNYSEVVGTGRRTKRDIYPARYDETAINNIATQVERGVPFTDKQQLLTIKLITKYRKQWKKIGYDVSGITESTPVKNAVRTNVDRNQYVYVEGDTIRMKFPYKPKVISLIAKYARKCRGRMQWNKESRSWQISITPDNVYWAKQFAADHKFEIDKSFTDLCNQVDNAYDYKNVQLDIVNQKLVLHDVPESMRDWIHENIGEIEMSNFVKIASASSLLAFTLSDAVVEHTTKHYSALSDFILQQQSFVNSNDMQLGELLTLIKQLDYNNIIFFVSNAPGALPLMKTLAHDLPEYLMCPLGVLDKTSLNGARKTVSITSKVIPAQPDLIISFAGFMATESRKEWFNNTAKVIYYCPDIDSKLKKKIKRDNANYNYKR